MLYKSLSVIKSIYYNFRLFPFKQAIKFPLFINWSCKAELYKGAIIFESEPRMGALRFGEGGSKGVPLYSSSNLIIEQGGVMLIEGTARFGTKNTVRISHNASLHIGNNFNSNVNCFISCDGNMHIGNDVLLGWNIAIRDSDGHSIIDGASKEIKNHHQDVVIGNHVWIASCANILKGTNLPNDTVVAYGSLVNKHFVEERTIIAGNPAKVVKTNVEWKM